MTRSAGLFAAFLAIAAICAAAGPSARAAEGLNPVVMRVNSKPVTRFEVQLEIERLLPTASYHGRVSDEAWARVVDEALEDAIGNELAYQDAVSRGVKIPGKPVDQVEKAAIQRAGSEDAFENLLKAEGLVREDFRRFQTKKLLAAKRQEQVMAGIAEKASLTDADLAKYYKENKQKFSYPPSVDAQHLLVGVPPWSSAEEWKAGKERAAAIAKRARAGEDFTKLVQENSSDEASKKDGGKLASLHGGRYAKMVEKAVEGLGPGEVGGPVRSLYGFHVVKLLARNPRRQLSFAEINKEQLRKDLRSKLFEEGLEAWRGSLRKNARIVTDEEQTRLIRSGRRAAAPGSGHPPK
ncbi:MAG: peptidylprolyl isomerase [Myxococcota bacterium]